MRIFRSKVEEVLGGWRKLHNDEINILYSLLSINKMIKSRRMSGACGSHGKV
jgi:hypothetical protein